MRAIIAFFALWALMLTPTVAQEADLAKAKSFVDVLADDAITILSTESDEGYEWYFRLIAED